MGTKILAAAILTALVSTRQVEACDIVSIRTRLPGPEAIRAVGVVTGYGDAMDPAPGVGRTASLHVTLEAMPGQRDRSGEQTVVPLDYGTHCRRIAIPKDLLARRYAVGARVAVSAAVKGGLGALAANEPVVAKVEVVPVDLARTVDGDLDFSRLDDSTLGSYGEFEFDRAVQALRVAPASQRLPRLFNLVNYRGLRESRAGRQLVDALLSESQISAADKTNVLNAYQRSLENAR